MARPAAVLALVLVLTGGLGRGSRGRQAPVAVTLVVLAGIAAGLTGGAERLDAIDGGALAGPAGDRISLTGYALSAPRWSHGLVRFPIESPRGRVMVQSLGDRGPATARSDLGGVDPGAEVAVAGVLKRPPSWYRPTMRRQGLAMVVHAESVSLTGSRRGGIPGLVDRMRSRAEAALERAMPFREAALARGFVLGQDSSIDPATVEQFRDSGLAHLLAVSGQNVILLALLAAPFMAVAGLRPTVRLVLVAGLILIYVPLAGGGPSIQRAGVMGLAGLAAAAATRPASRVYAIVLAVVVTLALNPRASGDPGWQLSFAAVLGILVLAAPLRARLVPLTGGDGWRAGLNDGIAITVAAALATAPLMAAHFDRLALGTVLANLLALPAVAPSMWLGMISAAAGQVSSLAAVPFNLVNSVLLAFIARVAGWFSGPGWVLAGIASGGPIVAVLGYLLLAGLLAAGSVLWPAPRDPDGSPEPPRSPAGRWLRPVALLLGAVLLLVLVWQGPGLFGEHRRDLAPPPPGGARVEILDIGQGDATLIRPDGADPVLIDGGPPGGDLRGALDSAGVGRLAAVILTHGDLDHWGGLADLFGPVEVDRFLFDVAPARLLAQARRSGAAIARIGAGQRIRFGNLELDLIWPPARQPGERPPAGSEPNARSVVAILEWKRFRMLLTGDAESELVPLSPGPVDVLRVAHHGSDDAGLDRLLDQTRPALAVISVGEDNRFGHPTGATLDSLDEAGVGVLRTDRNGTVSVVLDHGGFSIETGR
ncbi:MAG: ComEC/Rec2 family competence protein [Solirubrobacterales bacterium]|nr:ComEC/Rec2 family competence protein [Solirubrobacterales bacterium]